jgi:lipopolysaccharide export system protein LptC
MKRLAWSRPLAYVAVIAVVAGAYFIGQLGRGNNGADEAAQQTPDPGYAAHDAEIIETGYDGRERYRLNAKVIRQQSEAGTIELDTLEMKYHPGAQVRVAGESRPAGADKEVWHLASDHGLVRANGDDIQLKGNVRVTGASPASGTPLSFTTSELRINTPTEFIETRAPVKFTLSGYELQAKGLTADLKAGTLSLESNVHGQIAPK